MQVRLATYKLSGYYWTKIEEIAPGMRVCPSNGCTSVGTIVDVGPLAKRNDYHTQMTPKWVKVMWGTGKKKGKIQTYDQHDLDNLVNADRYLAAIDKEHQAVIDLVEEAKSYGM